MQDFRNIEVWQKAHRLTMAVYAATRPFPTDERYGLTAQMRRAASAVPTNIAEGCVLQSDAEFRRFLFIALGSGSELDYLLLLSRDLGYLTDASYAPLKIEIDGVKQMLVRFIQKLTARH